MCMLSSPISYGSHFRIGHVTDENSIVGKGIHSANHVQKIKPRVERVCREMGLKYATEDNAGRVYVNLTGGAADLGAVPSPYHHQPQQHHHHQQNNQPDEVQQVVNAVLPKVLRKLEKACCVVM